MGRGRCPGLCHASPRSCVIPHVVGKEVKVGQHLFSFWAFVIWLDFLWLGFWTLVFSALPFGLQLLQIKLDGKKKKSLDIVTYVHYISISYSL